MKRTLILPLLLLLLLLAACGRDRAEEQGGSMPGEEQVALSPHSLSEARAMARVLGANRVLVEENRLYCYDFDEAWSPVLACYSWQDGALGDFRILARGCVPEYLCRVEGWLCYIDRSSGALERVPEQGGARELLREGPCSCLTVREGLLYFCDGEGRFLSLDPRDNTETVLLESPCSFAYPLEKALLFREGESGRLLLQRGDGSRQVLSPEGASPPLLLGDLLWYSADGALFAHSLSSGETRSYALPEHDGDLELLPTAEGLRLRGIRDENGPAQWAGPPEGPFLQQARGYRICDWLGEELRVDTVYEPDGRIRCYLLQDGEGRQISFLAGRTA